MPNSARGVNSNEYNTVAVPNRPSGGAKNSSQSNSRAGSIDKKMRNERKMFNQTSTGLIKTQSMVVSQTSRGIHSRSRFFGKT
jgi:hypothetical protein